MSNDRLHIQSIGYIANNNPSRAIRSGAEFEELLPAPDWQEVIVRRNANVEETVKEMQALIRKSAWQTQRLAERLKGKDIYTTCKNIWNFLFDHFKYKEDDKGEEQLRTPALSWYLRTIRGIDCDDFTIFASTMLYNLGISHYIRIAKYETRQNPFQHVYDTLPYANSYIVIDGVLDQFNAEKEPVETKDFLMKAKDINLFNTMSTTHLNGIDVTVLSGIEDEALNELQNVISGVDFQGIDELEGLGRIPSEQDELGAIYRHLVRTRNVVRQHPHYIKQVEHPDTVLGMLNYAIDYWHTDKRDEALGILADKEDELNALQGLDALPENEEQVQLFFGVEGLEGLAALGKVKAKRSFFKAVKQATSKAGKGVKNLKKKIVNSNVVLKTRRAGVLLAMKLNFLKLAERIKWGYLTREEAVQNGFDLNEWQQAVGRLQEITKLFVDELQGQPEALRKAILTGRAGGLSGLGDIDGTDDELGAVVAATTSSAIATAMPILKRMMAIAGKLNLKKLVKKVNPRKLFKGRKKAEKQKTESTPDTAEDPAAQTNAPETPSQDKGEESVNTDSGKAEQSPRNLPQSKAPDDEASKTADGGQTANLPANTDTQSPAAQAKESSEASPSNPLTKAVNWVKENPGTTAVIAGGLIIGGYFVFRKKDGLSGTKRGKKRKGNAKKNPPQAISGTKSKSKAKPKPKGNSKGKGKGKGGTPRVTL